MAVVGILATWNQFEDRILLDSLQDQMSNRIQTEVSIVQLRRQQSFGIPQKLPTGRFQPFFGSFPCDYKKGSNVARESDSRVFVYL